MPLKDRDVIQSYPLDLLEALERLAGSYGSDVVRDATRQLLAKPRGRSVLDDFALMRPRLIVEAQGWLAGNDLDARGRQQRIASEVAAGNPGHSFEATRERLRGKLRARWKGMVIMLAVPELLRNAPTSVLLHKMRQALRIEPSLAPLTNLIADLVADTLTHVLGVRAFGTQLLCEQVIGRALRRQSYELNSDGHFDVEYADVLGIPFDFTAAPVVAGPKQPKNMVRVHAVSPDRDDSEIRFPRVEGYRTELPQDVVRAQFNADSTLELTPELVGATETVNSGIVGETADLTIEHLADMRPATIQLHLAKWIVTRRMTDPGQPPNVGLIMQMRTIVRRWMAEHLHCLGGTQPAQLLYYAIADRVADRVMAAVTRGQEGGGRVLAMLDPYNREGSTRHVSFMTSKDRYETSPRCHINFAVIDSDWEAEFCRVADQHSRVLAWVKNHNLGFEVPYSAGGQARRYRPDFILRIDDGQGADNLLNLVVEIKGARDEDDKDKAETMRTLWVPGVNALGTQGRWAFAEFTDVWTIASEFAAKVEAWLDGLGQKGR